MAAKKTTKDFVYHNFLETHYISHRIMCVNFTAVTALLCNSNVYSVTLNNNPINSFLYSYMYLNCTQMTRNMNLLN